MACSRGLSSPVVSSLWAWKHGGSILLQAAVLRQKVLLTSTDRSASTTTVSSSSKNYSSPILQPQSAGGKASSALGGSDLKTSNHNTNASNSEDLHKKASQRQRWVPPRQWAQSQRESSSDSDWNRVDNHRKVSIL
jgi:hypothetical protein